MSHVEPTPGAPANPRLRQGFGAELAVLGGFFYRRMAVFFSNRSETVFELAEMLAYAISVGLLGVFVSQTGGQALAGFLQGCDDYTAFLITGFLVHLLVWSARGNVAWLVRSREFPSLFMAPRHILTLIIGANMWKYVWILFQVAFFVGVSEWLFGVRLHINAAFAIVVLCGLLLMTAFDMLGAAFRVITKSEADPLNWVLTLSGLILSGRLFPVDVLPSWAQRLAHVHPEYYINTFARRTLGGGASIGDVWQELAVFLALAVGLLVGSYFVFRLGFNRARIEGTLGHQ